MTNSHLPRIVHNRHGRAYEVHPSTMTDPLTGEAMVELLDLEAGDGYRPGVHRSSICAACEGLHLPTEAHVTERGRS